MGACAFRYYYFDICPSDDTIIINNSMPEWKSTNKRVSSAKLSTYSLRLAESSLMFSNLLHFVVVEFLANLLPVITVFTSGYIVKDPHSVFEEEKKHDLANGIEFARGA